MLQAFRIHGCDPQVHIFASLHSLHSSIALPAAAHSRPNHHLLILSYRLHLGFICARAAKRRRYTLTGIFIAYLICAVSTIRTLVHRTGFPTCVAMLFRRHNPSRLHPVDPPPDLHVAPLPVNISLQTPKTVEGILAISASLPKAVPQGPWSSSKRSQSLDSSRSEHSSERDTNSNPIPKREPRSKKTGHATIRTDATDTHAAFESDAFAVHMPTTRVPIIDSRVSVARPSPTAQAEAFRTYMEKAQQVRERNNSQGLRVPSKIVSYDYASPDVTGHKAPLVRALSPPTSPPTPAGSFPTSPSQPQAGSIGPERQYRSHIKGPRAINEANRLYAPRKAVASEINATTPSTRCQYRTDLEVGASLSTSSPIPHPLMIKARVKPKITMVGNDRVQTASRYSLYNRSSPPSSIQTSRSSSPTKSMPNFTRRVSIEGDSIFGYMVKDTTGTMAGASSTSDSDKEKERSKLVERGKRAAPKRSLTSRWPWRRSPGLSVDKASSLTARTTAAKKPAYVDPFIIHASPVPAPMVPQSPVASRPASPKKLSRPNQPAPTGNFDSGFAQIKSLTLLLFKISVYLYAVIALWFVLDAVRQTFHTLGAPFRVLRFLGGTVWVWGSWVVKMLIKMWENWGFKISLKGGGMWKMRWC